MELLIVILRMPCSLSFNNLHRRSLLLSNATSEAAYDSASFIYWPECCFGVNNLTCLWLCVLSPLLGKKERTASAGTWSFHGKRFSVSIALASKHQSFWVQCVPTSNYYYLCTGNISSLLHMAKWPRKFMPTQPVSLAPGKAVIPVNDW